MSQACISVHSRCTTSYMAGAYTLSFFEIRRRTVQRYCNPVWVSLNSPLNQNIQGLYSPARCSLLYFSSAPWLKIWIKCSTCRLCVWQAACTTEASNVQANLPLFLLWLSYVCCRGEDRLRSMHACTAVRLYSPKGRTCVRSKERALNSGGKEKLEKNEVGGFWRKYTWVGEKCKTSGENKYNHNMNIRLPLFWSLGVRSEAQTVLAARPHALAWRMDVMSWLGAWTILYGLTAKWLGQKGLAIVFPWIVENGHADKVIDFASGRGKGLYYLIGLHCKFAALFAKNFLQHRK